MGRRRMSRDDQKARDMRTKEPSLIEDWGVSILRRSQKGLGVEKNQFTRRKIQKTGSVGTRNTGWAHGLTPRSSPLPGVLDLYNGE